MCIVCVFIYPCKSFISFVISITVQTIKLEPTNAGVPTETWEGSNQSYEDGGGSISGSGSGSCVIPVAGDQLSIQLPLHADMTEASQLHDSSRVSVPPLN